MNEWINRADLWTDRLKWQLRHERKRENIRWKRDETHTNKRHKERVEFEKERIIINIREA